MKLLEPIREMCIAGDFFCIVLCIVLAMAIGLFLIVIAFGRKKNDEDE